MQNDEEKRLLRQELDKEREEMRKMREELERAEQNLLNKTSEWDA